MGTVLHTEQNEELRVWSCNTYWLCESRQCIFLSAFYALFKMGTVMVSAEGIVVRIQKDKSSKTLSTVTNKHASSK